LGIGRDNQLAGVRQRAEIIQLPPTTPPRPTGPGCCWPGRPRTDGA